MTEKESIWYVGTRTPSPSITTGVGPDETPNPETCVLAFLTEDAALDWIATNGYGGTLEAIECLVWHVPVEYTVVRPTSARAWKKK